MSSPRVKMRYKRFMSVFSLILIYGCPLVVSRFLKSAKSVLGWRVHWFCRVKEKIFFTLNFYQNNVRILAGTQGEKI
jgi:hypothetical protein